MAKLCFDGYDSDSSDDEIPFAKPPHGIYPLLTCVKEGCTPADLQKGIDAAFQDLAESEALQKGKEEQDMEKEEEGEYFVCIKLLIRQNPLTDFRDIFTSVIFMYYFALFLLWCMQLIVHS